MSETTKIALRQIDAAKALGVSDRTLRRWGKRKKKPVKGKRQGGVKLYPIATLKKLAGI